jgi:ABC-type bacteriocin/lantibiotic exporter with double-glycine peptidase domain
MTLDDAWQAARAVGLGREIEQLPMGMHTVVTENGRTFSGGQRQRLLIARAIISHPRILFWDEATNELDGVNQEQITASLANLQATRLVIAHRLSTIVNADSIYVIAGGHIVQRGTFNELILQSGPFENLARRQLV